MDNNKLTNDMVQYNHSKLNCGNCMAHTWHTHTITFKVVTAKGCGYPHKQHISIGMSVLMLIVGEKGARK